jgi:leucyl-tRNA synthetase
MEKCEYFPASLKLRDWLVSRQRKWGTPIPAISCLDCGHNSVVPMADLPVHHNPASTDAEYPVCYNKGAPSPSPSCSNCGSSNTRRETDTLDTFFDSSWYFLRYLDPQNESAIFNPEKVRPLIPVRTYVGGKEHGEEEEL